MAVKSTDTRLEDVTIYNRGSGALDAIIRAPEARTSGHELASWTRRAGLMLPRAPKVESWDDPCGRWRAAGTIHAGDHRSG
jgi:hypothetical protein